MFLLSLALLLDIALSQKVYLLFSAVFFVLLFCCFIVCTGFYKTTEVALKMCDERNMFEGARIQRKTNVDLAKTQLNCVTRGLIKYFVTKTSPILEFQGLFFSVRFITLAAGGAFGH